MYGLCRPSLALSGTTRRTAGGGLSRTREVSIARPDAPSHLTPQERRHSQRIPRYPRRLCTVRASLHPHAAYPRAPTRPLRRAPALRVLLGRRLAAHLQETANHDALLRAGESVTP